MVVTADSVRDITHPVHLYTSAYSAAVRHHIFKIIASAQPDFRERSMSFLRRFIKNKGLDIETVGKGRTKEAITNDIESAIANETGAIVVDLAQIRAVAMKHDHTFYRCKLDHVTSAEDGNHVVIQMSLEIEKYYYTDGKTVQWPMTDQFHEDLLGITLSSFFVEGSML